VTRYRPTHTIDQKLGEIPLDERSKRTPGIRLDKPKHWVRRTTIHFTFVKHVKLYVKLTRYILLNFGISAGLLTPKLIARERKDGQALFLVLAVNRRQLTVIRLG